MMNAVNSQTGEVLYTASQEIDKLALALSKAQLAFSAITKSKTVTVRTTSGTNYSYNYAPLDSILSATRKALSENGLAVVQTTHENGTTTLVTTLMHSSGQWISSTKALGNHADPKQFGGVMTYHRRYQISAILGVSSEDDDDASGASGESATVSTKPEKPQKPQDTPKSAQQPKAENGTSVPNSPQALFEMVNNRVTVTYDNVSHMFNAIRAEAGDTWTWPEKKDTEGWRAAYAAAVKHAKAKEQPVAA